MNKGNWYIRTMEYDSVLKNKKKRNLPFATRWIELEDYVKSNKPDAQR